MNRLISAFAVAALLSACGDEPTGPRGGPLVPGESRLVSGASGSEKLFTITVPAGTGTLQVRLTEGSGDADLVVRYGARPEPGLADCLSESDGNEEECLFDAPEPGTYYILVYGFTDYANLRVLGNLLPQSGATALTAGVPVEAISGGGGSFRMYSISVPAGATSLNVTFDATGDADLYLRRGALPLLNSYDCASFTDTGTESCAVNAPQSGLWFIRVEGFAPYTAGTLRASITLPPP